MMDYSSFSGNQQDSLRESLPVSGFMCEAYRVKIYGKLHFLKKTETRARGQYSLSGGSPEGI